MEQLNFIVVFLEGILSFLSPCVLPIIPIYLAILSNSSGSTELENDLRNNRRILIKNTILFVLGISTTFFILGTGINVLRPFLTENKRLLLIVGGILILFMGFFYIGDLNIPFLQRERKFQYRAKRMSPIAAYILGFTFSFGWTPCIGPMLASVLVLASTKDSQLLGNLLIGTYTLGFIIPFIIVAIFSSRMLKALDKIKVKRSSLQKIGGYILIITGFIIVISGIRELRIIVPTKGQTKENKQEKIAQEEVYEEDDGHDPDEIVAPDFKLEDQYGNTHTLSDYKGKVVFLNFWATWCPPCRGEMPDIEKVYQKYGLNEEDVVVLGVATPNIGNEVSKEEIISFLEGHEYSFPVVFDETGELLYNYYITAFPTTFIINTEGNVELYAPGAMNQATMESLIERGKK